MRAGVCSFSFGYAPYAEFSSKIWQRYCDIHGYSFRSFGLPEDMDDRNPIWGKVKGVRRTMEEFDMLFYVDSDTYVQDWTQRFEDILPPDRWMAVAPDVKNADFAWNQEGINSGVFVLRCLDGSKRMMEEWWDAPAQDPESRWIWPIEQRAFDRIIFPKYKEKVLVVPYYVLNGTDGKFVRHLFRTDFSDQQRTDILRAKWEEVE